jgi:hypothetical protein
VWVEPVEWDEAEKGTRPIKQIQVRTWNYLDSKTTQPCDAYRELGKECEWIASAKAGLNCTDTFNDKRVYTVADSTSHFKRIRHETDVNGSE